MPTPSDVRTQVIELVRDLDAETLTGQQAAEAVTAFSTIEKAASAGRMFAAVRVAQTDAWRGQGHLSAADWLAAQAGISVREAHAQLGTAKKADALPKTKRAMRAGSLSPTQAGAVTDGAAADPAAEEDLLGSAERDTTTKLRERAAKAKAAATDSATRERRIRSERSVRTRTDAEGAFCLTLRGPAADGVRLEAMLRPYEEWTFAKGRRAGERETFENRRYDAFFAMLARMSSGAGGSNSSGGAANDVAATGSDRSGDVAEPTADRGPAGPAGASAPCASAPCAPKAEDRGDVEPTSTGAAEPSVPDKLPGGNNVKVIVRIDHSALARGRTVAGETCDVAGVGPISVATAQSLMEDAFVAAVITKGHDVVNVAHLGRGLNARQRTAIEWTGVQCSNIACNRTIAVQVDHRVSYAARQETALPNQDPLCPDCHRRKTHHGWRLESGSGRRRFLDAASGSDPPDAAVG